jgi:hypothetical protein
MIPSLSSSIVRRTLGLCVLSACAASLALAQGTPIARIVKEGNKVTLMVDGKPFIMLGGQVGNFTAFPDRMERAWPIFKAMNLNTVEYPVYWNVIEPEEGKFDFTAFDQILRGLRAQGLRAVLLWFGTWKNGAMDWSPNWVKSNPTRFPRVIDSGGHPIRVLSPHAPANLDADRKAYTTMMKHLREVDEADRTVIMIQTENEPGLLGSSRDFSPEATRQFNGPVPAALVSALKKKPGTWKEVFGDRLADESFSAYSVATYINEVARAGKEIYPLPAYVNAWQGGSLPAQANLPLGGESTQDPNQPDRFDRPGETYPSGGAVTHMLDLWKAAAHDIDLLAPDIYHQSPIIYRQILAAYHRSDNPLFVPETGRGIAARALFWALADHSAIGFSPYGVEGGARGSEPNPDFAAVGDGFRLIRSAIPLIVELQGTDKLKAVAEEEEIPSRLLYFDRYDLLVRFRPPAGPGSQAAQTARGLGRALVCELGPDEFLVLGFDAAVEFKPAMGSAFTAAQLLQVEYGTYENSQWKATERGSTSQSDYALPTVRLPSQGAMIRVRLMRY